MFEYFKDVGRYFKHIYTLALSVRFIKSMLKQLLAIESIKLKKYFSFRYLYEIAVSI